MKTGWRDAPIALPKLAKLIKHDIEAVFPVPKHLFNMLSQSLPSAADQNCESNVLNEKDLSTGSCGDITLLLRTNILEAFMQLEVQKGNPGQTVAVKTPLEWTSFENCVDSSKRNNYAGNVVNVHTTQQTFVLVKTS